jgi:hypothetical protein
MSTEVSVKLQAIHYPISATSRNILRLLTYKQNKLARKSDKAVVLWGTSLFLQLGGCCYHLTRFGVVLKICSNENDLNNSFFFKFTSALVGFAE